MRCGVHLRWWCGCGGGTPWRKGGGAGLGGCWVPVPVCGAGCVGVGAGMPVWVWCDMCAWLRLWCRVAVGSLQSNNIGPEGAAAISRSLASVPQLQTL